MMSHCLVRGCRSDSGTTDSSVTFHPFPTERAAAERWASLCGVSGQECFHLLKDLEHGSTGRYKLCSLHFEESAFEKNPDTKTCSVKLRQGAEPTHLLSPTQRGENDAQINTSLPTPHSPHRQAPPSTPSCSSCTCARSVPQSSKAEQVPDCGQSSNVRYSVAEPRAQVSQCTTETTVVSPQPGVSQIVLNFRDQEKGLTLDNVSSESVPQCSGGCRCQQRMVKQVVLIFLGHPQESISPTLSRESPSTLSSSTQTEGRDGNSETNAQIHPERPVHHLSSPRQISHQEVSTQTSTCAEVSSPQQNCEVQDSPEPMDSSPKTSEVSSSPVELIGLSASKFVEPDQQILQSCQELIQSTQNDLTRGQADLNSLPPTLDKLQPAPESLDKAFEHIFCVASTSTAASQTLLTDDQAPRPLRKCEQRPQSPSQRPRCAHSPQTSRQFCLNPSINKYVGDLLERCNLPSPCVPSGVSSAQYPCISAQRCVKQIVLNFVEKESTSVNQEVPAPCTSRELSYPVVMSQHHRETQTYDFLQRTAQSAKEKSKSLQTPLPRPPKSHSCPPVLYTPKTLSQEEESSPDHPMNKVLAQDISDRLENKVTFEDVAIYFCKEEWELLGVSEKNLYREVMSDNCQSLIFLGLLKEKPDLVSRIDNEEENLWVNQESHRRIHHHEEDLFFLDQDMDGVRMLADDDDTSPSDGKESNSSSHLGALMRLVSEIPGFLLGNCVTDGSGSPACSTEDRGSSLSLEVKTEEPSPACSPASAQVPLSETPEIKDSLGVHRSGVQGNKILAKAEKTEVCVSQSSRYSMPVCHPTVSLSCIKKDPGIESVQGRLQIKKEELPAVCSPAHNIKHQKDIPLVKPLISHLLKTPFYHPRTHDYLIPDHARRHCSGGRSSLSRSTATSPRNPSVSPTSPNHGTNCTGLGELKIKIKQEDSGSERDLAESPVYGRKVYHTPSSSATALQVERPHWRLAASPLRSPTDAPLGNSPLHRLVNCLKEITANRPLPYSNTLSTTRWGADLSRACTEASGKANSSREPMIPAPQPNPFTVAVTNGAAQLRGMEPKVSDIQSTKPSREESHMSNVPLSALGKCLEKIYSRGVPHSSEEPRRAELGVKRAHSDDLSCRLGVFGGAKRPALEVSSRVVSSCSPSHRDLWRPPEELPRVPSEDQPIGNSHLMSVMNCVRKIPAFRPSSSIHVTSTADTGRTCPQGVVTEGNDVKVKWEKDEKPPMEAFRQWIQPPQTPDVPKQTGPLAANVHLTGLMKLMEEIPCAESSNPSRTMYSIAVGHSLARKMDRFNYLSCNDDPSFQAELNDSTIASVDSVYSDDTSWSSENVDPSYSAIGGLQRVVSEFAELGSVSPLVAVAAPPVFSVQDGFVLKKPKEALTASASRLNESRRRSPRDAVGIATSACSAESGEAAIAAIRGLQKVVHGFVEQECVSPITAVRNNTPNTSLRDIPGKKTCQEEEAASPHLQGSSPGPVRHFLCDTEKWLSEPDSSYSSYSALSGLQKVVNGFSEMSCVSPFSAVSTPVSESTMEVSTQRKSDAQVQDFVSSSLGGQKNVINGVPDVSSLSPFTVASVVSSESDAGPTMKSRCERSDEDETSQKCSTERQRPATIAVPSRNESKHSPSSSSSHCIDLTEEEEPACSKNRTVALEKERKLKIREGPTVSRPTELSSCRPENPAGNRARLQGSSRTPCSQLIDLTVDEETLTKPKVSSSERTRKPSYTGIAMNSPLAEKYRHSINLPKAPSGRLDKPLDPGASGSNRGGVPAVNEHLSGLEKLLKGVTTFTPANRPSGQACSGSWWFKSTSSHET